MINRGWNHILKADLVKLSKLTGQISSEILTCRHRVELMRQGMMVNVDDEDQDCCKLVDESMHANSCIWLRSYTVFPLHAFTGQSLFGACLL